MAIRPDPAARLAPALRDNAAACSSPDGDAECGERRGLLDLRCTKTSAATLRYSLGIKRSGRGAMEVGVPFATSACEGFDSADDISFFHTRAVGRDA